MKLLSLNDFNTVTFAYCISAFQFPISQSECGLLNTIKVNRAWPILHTINQCSLHLESFSLTLYFIYTKHYLDHVLRPCEHTYM